MNNKNKIELMKFNLELRITVNSLHNDYSVKKFFNTVFININLCIVIIDIIVIMRILFIVLEYQKLNKI